MLQYFSWKKIRTHKDAAAAKGAASSESAAETAAANKPAAQSQKLEGPQPVISHHDEAILYKHLENVDEERIVILEGSSGATTPRPGSLPMPGAEALATNAGVKDVEEGKWAAGFRNRFGDLRRTVSSAAQSRRPKSKNLGPSKEEKGKWKEGQNEVKEQVIQKPKEAKSEERQADEFTAALEGLNLATENGRAFSMTPATNELLDRFIQILKDVANGVPTAYQDLVDLFDSSSKTLEDTFTSLPSFLQKIIKTLPKKMQANLTPELMRTAAVVSPAAAAELEALGGMLPTLQELVTKPGLVMGLLKSLVNLLKMRFPAMLGGTSLALSMGIFVLLFVLWYCYKRGRETRLEAEATTVAAVLVEGENGATESSANVPRAAINPRAGRGRWA